MATSGMIQLVADVHGCDAEVYLNDIPVTRLIEFRKEGTALPIHSWIVPGDNELKLVVNPGPEPALAQQPGRGQAIKPDAWAKARLVPVPLGAPPPDGPAYIEVNFVADASLPPDAPVVRRATGRLPIAFGRRIWEKGDRIESLTPALEASALAFVREIRDVLQRGDGPRFASLMRDKINDLAPSYGLNPQPELAHSVDLWQRAAKAPDWDLAPIDPALASLRLCGSNRCLECVDKEWQPLIRMRDLSAGGLLLRLGLGRVGNNWQVAF